MSDPDASRAGRAARRTYGGFLVASCGPVVFPDFAALLPGYLASNAPVAGAGDVTGLFGLTQRE